MVRFSTIRLTNGVEGDYTPATERGTASWGMVKKLLASVDVSIP